MNIVEQIITDGEEIHDGDSFFETYGWMPYPEGDELHEAEYRGRKVTLNKPFRTPDGPKKFAVYVKDGEKVKIVRFGDPEMKIKVYDPERRRNFRARHNCDDPGPHTKARYWSCRAGWPADGKLKI